MLRKLGFSLLAVAGLALVMATAGDAQAFFGRRGGSGGSSGSYGSNGSNGSYGSFGGRHGRRGGSCGSYGGSSNGCNSCGESSDCGCNGDSDGEHHETGYRGTQTNNANQPMPAPELREGGVVIQGEREHADSNNSARESKDNQDRASATNQPNANSSDEHRPLGNDKAERNNATGAEKQKQE